MEHAVRGVAALIVLVVSVGAASAQGVSSSPAAPSAAPAAAPCDRYGLSTVFRCMGHDLLGAVKGDSRRWLEIGGVLAGGSLLLDDEVFNSMTEPDKDTSIEVGEYLGEAGMHFGVPAAAYFISRATGHEAAADMSVAIVRTQVVNAIFTRGLKLLPRARPYQESATPTKGSFPSGHTSAAFATATVIQRKWGWRAGLPAYAVAAFVGTTRLQHVHYLSDVTFGAALGVASGLAVKLPGTGPSIAPIVSPGVAGVSLTIPLGPPS
jgi:membrane-associated phospholipid phosphatase